MNETRSMIAKLLSRGSTDLADDSALGETPGWDSFAQLNIMLELERRYGIAITHPRLQQSGGN
jgi:acyl carrier protein